MLKKHYLKDAGDITWNHYASIIDNFEVKYKLFEAIDKTVKELYFHEGFLKSSKNFESMLVQIDN